MSALVPYAGKELRAQSATCEVQQVLNLFRAGNSTLQIARKLNVPEHVVYNLLARARG